MASLQEYCRMLSTEQLESILQEYFNDSNAYPEAVVLTILEILTERNPHKCDTEAAWQDFLKYYAPWNEENDL